MDALASRHRATPAARAALGKLVALADWTLRARGSSLTLRDVGHVAYAWQQEGQPLPASHDRTELRCWLEATMNAAREGAENVPGLTHVTPTGPLDEGEALAVAIFTFFAYRGLPPGLEADAEAIPIDEKVISCLDLEWIAELEAQEARRVVSRMRMLPSLPLTRPDVDAQRTKRRARPRDRRARSGVRRNARRGDPSRSSDDDEDDAGLAGPSSRGVAA